MRKKVAIVTGAGRGIGKEVALAFARKKYQVIVAEIDSGLGNQTVDEISEMGEGALFVKTDVSKVNEVEAMVARVHEEFKRIDVLVNNAGISEFCDVFELDEMQWDKVIDTNLKSVFFASRAVARVMKKTGGSIVNMASTRAVMSEPGGEAYGASKGGILAVTHSLAASLGTYGITVNAVLPGWIETGDYGELKEHHHKQHLSGRVGKPADVARACLFLASRENDFITGAQLVVDGGMTRKMIYE
ncbi:MAG: SDR family oxidoreductase [Prolixibacteraceae bacterium]|jgi:NAD(P)-dependent dehydrogenase (short-subunit alcohol dehydrogenase family)|nr:SDR family oxidoreductase [Prolixibacteraceae bacterium]